MMENGKNAAVAAVVVTYNRLALLKECIASLRKQTRNVDEIIVVNNSSTDGTEEWLCGEDGLTVITQKNSGSSGGQHIGIKTAVEKGHDWIWCMDDDCLPQASALEELEQFIGKHDQLSIGFLASRVLWTDGTDHVMNRPGLFFNKNQWNFIGWNKYDGESCRIDASSFVSCLFNRKAVEAVGLPDANFFIYYDDLEYTVRFQNFANFFVPASVVVHKTRANAATGIGSFDGRAGMHQYFGLRNFCFFYRTRNKKLLIGLCFSLMRNLAASLLRGTFSYRTFTLNFSAVYHGLIGDMTYPHWSP